MGSIRSINGRRCRESRPRLKGEIVGSNPAIATKTNQHWSDRYNVFAMNKVKWGMCLVLKSEVMTEVG